MKQHEEGHLGGYVIGGDPATFYPDLWQWLLSNRNIKRVLDIGCGEGHALQWFLDKKVDGWGIDGCKMDNPRILQHDFTKGPFSPFGDDFDLGWSCEFVEHVEEKFIPNFMPSFLRCKMIAMTAAPPGQGGYHHVNCQTVDYWKNKMDKNGFVFLKGITDFSKTLVSHEEPWCHWYHSGMIFARSW